MTVVKSAYATTKNNLYQTPYWVTGVLLSWLQVAGLRVLEPAAGNHQMADVLAFNGADVFTADIETYSRRHDLAPFDFIQDGHALAAMRFDAVIGNPPYGPANRLATAFVRQALAMCDGIVAMLLTAKWDFGSTRFDLTRDNRRFRCKINVCDRIRWFDGEGTEDGTEDHAWFVWGPRGENNSAPSIFFARKPLTA